MNKELKFSNQLYLAKWEGHKEETRGLLINMLHSIQFLKIDDETDKNSYSQGIDFLLWSAEYLAIELKEMKKLQDEYEKDDKIKQYKKEHLEAIHAELDRLF